MQNLVSKEGKSKQTQIGTNYVDRKALRDDIELNGG